MRQHNLKIAGHTIAALCANEQRSGIPVVFLHGITVGIDFWPTVLPERVLNEFPWISLSLPGHFPSLAPDEFQAADVTAELFADLHSEALHQLVGNRPVALVGWSTGGFSALNLAARHPGQVQSVMSISGFAKGSWKGIIGRMQRLLALGSVGQHVFCTVWAALARHRWLLNGSLSLAAANTRAFRKSPLTRPALDAWQRALQGHDFDVLATLFERLAELDIRDILPRITAPTLITGGDRDPFVPADHTRYLAEHIPGARLHLFPQTGHMFFAEATAEFQSLLIDWLAETTGFDSSKRSTTVAPALSQA